MQDYDLAIKLDDKYKPPTTTAAGHALSGISRNAIVTCR
jgi:hypothetical protein